MSHFIIVNQAITSFMSFNQRPTFKENLDLNTNLTAKAIGNKHRENFPENKTCSSFGKKTMENSRRKGRT